MHVEIVFQPDDSDTPQVLFAEMSRETYADLIRIINDPKAADDVLQIPSRVTQTGPTRPWLYRVGRIQEIRAVD